MTLAAVCARTTSRSLKTDSLRTILPLHSMIARSLKFSTCMDNMELSALSIVEAKAVPKAVALFFSRIRNNAVSTPRTFGRLSWNVFLLRTHDLRRYAFRYQHEFLHVYCLRQ